MTFYIKWDSAKCEIFLKENVFLFTIKKDPDVTVGGLHDDGDIYA